jgi:hypothetical protein
MTCPAGPHGLEQIKIRWSNHLDLEKETVGLTIADQKSGVRTFVELLVFTKIMQPTALTYPKLVIFFKAAQ